jgi:hypothetical protein
MVLPPTARFHRAGLLAAALVAGLTGAAQAQVVAYGYGDSYAGPLIHGDYVGAPLTRFPRPTELVPSAWGYGTYGIPTVAGIRSAPVGTPTVYVIETPRAAARPARQARPRILSRARQGAQMSAARVAPVATAMAGSARVITMGLPRPQATPR